ncbi:GYD domain-containing protein [Saccharomonospora azurea]
MTTAIGFLKWTDGGARAYRDTVDRYEATNELANRLGVTVSAIYWTPGGPYDIVCVLESDDPDKITAFGLESLTKGNLRLQWATAYASDQMRELLSHV